MTMKKPIFISLLGALAALPMFAPAANAQSAGVSASASVNVKLAPDPTGMFLVGTPPVPIVRPHRVTVGLHRAGVVHTRVVGLQPAGVVYVGARARPYAWVSPPVAVIQPPGVVIATPAVVVDRPGVVVGAPAVVVDRPGVIVERPAVGVVVGAPVVAVGVPGVVVGAPVVGVVRPHVVVAAPAPVVVVKGRHDNGLHRGHFKGRRH